jgi:hypothetical protein
MRERRAQRRNDARQQPHQRTHVVFAVVQNILPLLHAERWPLQDALAHIVLASNVDLILQEIPQRAADRIETFLAVAALNRAVVHVVPKLDVGVERACRFTPT